MRQIIIHGDEIDFLVTFFDDGTIEVEHRSSEPDETTIWQEHTNVTIVE